MQISIPEIPASLLGNKDTFLTVVKFILVMCFK